VKIRAQKLAVLCILSAVCLFAQDWTTVTSWPTVDMAGLTATQKATVLKIMREQGCSCGCGMKIAECRTKDPSCTYSRGLASVIVDAVRHGKSEKEAWAAAAASEYAKGPAQHNELLEAAVTVPTADAPTRGPADARVTLVEFSDFQCPFCIAATPQLESVLKAYPSQVKLVFKEFPLDSHSQAALAAAAALSARNQGKFWPMYDRLFAQQGNLSRKGILALASGAGLDMKRFQTDLDSAEVKKAVDKDITDGEHIGVDSTPTLFMNGHRYNGPITLAALKPVIDGELKHPGAATKTGAAR